MNNIKINFSYSVPGRLEGGGIAALSTSDSVLVLLGLSFLIIFSSLEDDLKAIIINHMNILYQQTHLLGDEGLEFEYMCFGRWMFGDKSFPSTLGSSPII